jgi:hypothetical protein
MSSAWTGSDPTVPACGSVADDLRFWPPTAPSPTRTPNESANCQRKADRHETLLDAAGEPRKRGLRRQCPTLQPRLHEGGAYRVHTGLAETWQRKRELPTQGGQARDTARCSGRTEETWSEAAMPIHATKTSRGRCVPGSYGAGRDVAVAGQAVQNVDGLATAEVQWPAQFLSKVYGGGADATRAAKGADARAQGGESDQLEDCGWPGCAFLPLQTPGAKTPIQSRDAWSARESVQPAGAPSCTCVQRAHEEARWGGGDRDRCPCCSDVY